MKIGVLGGSGLYAMESLTEVEEVRVDTPFGDPSDAFIKGKLAGVDVYFLPRHGRGHRLLPAEINHKANIWAFKSLGVSRIISVSAVGSLKEEYRPRDIVLPDQYFDRTKGSLGHTFFGNGIVGHISFSEPTCSHLRSLIEDAATGVIAAKPGGLDCRVTSGGTYINMEGPAFSTKAESHVYRSMGFDVIGMTSLPEAKLCREAEICYQGMSMVTDYDCWHESEEAVSVDMLIGHLTANSSLAKEILEPLIASAATARECDCGEALKFAIFTQPDDIPNAVKADLDPIIGKYVSNKHS